MRLSFLRALDRRLGLFFLHALAPPMRFLAWALAKMPRAGGTKRFVFLKLKGGGSLIVAMPALMGLRRRYPDAEFVLVCTTDARIYAELTGVFDSYLVIDDGSLFGLACGGLNALMQSFRAACCVDLEPNSMLAGLFVMLTCAARRIGLVRPQESARAAAYTDAIAFDPLSPVYGYYDHICALLGGTPAAPQLARARMQALLPPAPPRPAGRNIGLAAFTSDFARERMMPPYVWADLLRKNFAGQPARLMIFGSPRNRDLAAAMTDILTQALPHATIENLAGSGNLAQAAAQLMSCDEVWAVDSGLLHIARLLGVKTRSFWGPTMPAQRLRPIDGLAEETRYRSFLCSPCIQQAAPPCGGRNLCMITMAEDQPDLRPAWAKP